MKNLAALLLFGLLSVGCTDTPKGFDAFDDLYTTTNEDEECSNKQRVYDRGSIEGTLNGDVDGDGTEDEVTLRIDRQGQQGCEAFVVLEFEPEGGTRSVTFEPVWLFGAEGGLPAPRLGGFKEINGRPGLEILVDEMSGASTQFVGVLTFTDSTLERIEPESLQDIWDGANNGVFPYGGSVGHIEGVDCAGDEIVVSTALPDDSTANRYEVTRRFFSVVGSELVEARDKETELLSAQEVFEDLPEFRSSPFGSCPAA